ncbi:hypothetical protein DLAC_08747 [Tieghemostelium lacteum]|uniref:Uncharacterized protein n=1 Tax=Tieghemostelium lacteum TaxID=361077 RepID=A0A151Z858_TIELA|nr:hypothetical protein DLAC_08747 [Tieghemostelium lacteum]|eukprot:KYQ90156.1 hypothetical protein DLAC_08747 [Tieghemostelium lacteum]
MSCPFRNFWGGSNTINLNSPSEPSPYGCNFSNLPLDKNLRSPPGSGGLNFTIKTNCLLKSDEEQINVQLNVNKKEIIDYQKEQFLTIPLRNIPLFITIVDLKNLLSSVDCIQLKNKDLNWNILKFYKINSGHHQQHKNYLLESNTTSTSTTSTLQCPYQSEVVLLDPVITNLNEILEYMDESTQISEIIKENDLIYLLL